MLLGQKPMGSYCNELTEANLRDIVTELISMLFMMTILAFFKKSPRRLSALKRTGQLRILFGPVCAGISTNPYSSRGGQIIAGSARRPESGSARQCFGTFTANIGHAWHHSP